MNITEQSPPLSAYRSMLTERNTRREQLKTALAKLDTLINGDEEGIAAIKSESDAEAKSVFPEAPVAGRSDTPQPILSAVNDRSSGLSLRNYKRLLLIAGAGAAVFLVVRAARKGGRGGRSPFKIKEYLAGSMKSLRDSVSDYAPSPSQTSLEQPVIKASVLASLWGLAAPAALEFLRPKFEMLMRQGLQRGWDWVDKKASERRQSGSYAVKNSDVPPPYQGEGF